MELSVENLISISKDSIINKVDINSVVGGTKIIVKTAKSKTVI